VKNQDNAHRRIVRILACGVIASVGLSGCTQVDNLFDSNGGTTRAAPVMAQPAADSPRNQVKAGSMRCDGVTDDRTWLDCYYGAAQPVRSELGLAPAPASQQSLVPSP
jgi:hypothetical protein